MDLSKWAYTFPKLQGKNVTTIEGPVKTVMINDIRFYIGQKVRILEKVIPLSIEMTEFMPSGTIATIVDIYGEHERGLEDNSNNPVIVKDLLIKCPFPTPYTIPYCYPVYYDEVKVYNEKQDVIKDLWKI